MREKRFGKLQAKATKTGKKKPKLTVVRPHPRGR
jgi:hypothetical protein